MKNLYKILLARLFNQTNSKKYNIATSNTKSLSAYQKLIQQEINILKLNFKNRPEPKHPELFKQTSNEVIWRIQLANQEYYYMKRDSGFNISQNEYVIYIDTEILYLALLQNALTSNPNEMFYSQWLRQNMSQDDKYPIIAKKFLHSLDNPIPLAEINCGICDSLPSFSFTNGITRTIWLISNYANSFPITTYGKESANLLNNIAGLTDCPIAMTQLFN